MAPAPVQQVIWQWRPTSEEQRELFEEWKLFCIGYLVTSNEGVNVRSIANYLAEHVGDPVPLQKMGFPSINHFLYEMADSIEVRTMDGFKIFIFIRDHVIPESMIHVRDMVLNQAKDKSCKGRNGDIRRPTKKQSIYASVNILLQNAPRRPSYNNQAQQYQYPRRPIVSPVYPTGNFNNGPRGGVTSGGGGGMVMKSSRPLTGIKKHVSSSPQQLQKTQKVSYYVRPGSAGHVSLANPVTSTRNLVTSTPNSNPVTSTPKPVTSTPNPVNSTPNLVNSTPNPVTSTRNLVYDDWGDLVSQEPAKKPPPKKTFGGNYVRPRFLPGLDDEDDTDTGDTDGFDYCSGENAFPKITVRSGGNARSVELENAFPKITVHNDGNARSVELENAFPKITVPNDGNARSVELENAFPKITVHSDGTARSFELANGSTTTAQATASLQEVAAAPVESSAPTKATPVYSSAQSRKVSEAVAPTPSKPVRKSRIRIAIPTTPTKATPAQYVPISTTTTLSSPPQTHASLVPPSSESVVQKPVEAKEDPHPDITDGKKKPRKDAATCPKCSKKKNTENTMDPLRYPPGRIKMFKSIPEMTFPDLLRGGNKSEANNSLRSFLNAGLKATAYF